MLSKNLTIVLFAVLAIAQLYVPISMIFSRETVLEDGKVYKFKTAPIDPYDPFRGKYITLQFSETNYWVENAADWTIGQDIYLVFEDGEDDYARIKKVLKTAPSESPYYLKTKITSTSNRGGERIYFQYPFNRFYMEESKAQPAENLYRESQRDSTMEAYTLVYLFEGEAVIENVFIDDIPIAEYVIQQQLREELQP